MWKYVFTTGFNGNDISVSGELDSVEGVAMRSVKASIILSNAFQENWIVWKFVVVSLAVWAIFLMPWFQENWIVWKDRRRIRGPADELILRFQENWIVWKFFWQFPL